MSDVETKVIVGQCVEISERNGWTAFEINHGGQYTTKVSTKVAAIIEAARAVGSDTATWTYKESDGKENPNKPGTFYKNRYLDKVEAGEHAPADTGGGSPQQTSLPVETSKPVDWDEKERRDFRSRSWAITVSAFAHTVTADDDPVEVIKKLLPFQKRLYHDIVRELGVPDDKDIPF